jgi:flagellar motility protein MotE (MotC chaperone)
LLPKLLKKSSSGLRALIVAKLALLAVYFVAMDHGFMIGDKTAAAKDEPVAKGEDKAQSSGKNEAKDEKKTAGASGTLEDEGDTAKPRKSFLSNLFELPKLDTESMRKEELGRYLEIAERKERQLKERLDVLKRREDQLKSLEQSIEDKLRKLDEERKYFAQTIQQEKDMKNERVTQLIGMYAKMEPKKAAPVFEKLDKDLVVELFKKLPQKQVTAILEAMSADKSVQISEYYGRVRSAREYDILKEMNQSLRKEFDDCKGMPAKT